MTKMTNARRWQKFCHLWIWIGSLSVVDANRRISAAGYDATMRLLGGAA